MKDAKVNMNRPPLSEEDIDKAKDFDQLMKMNVEPPIKIKWGKIGGVIAVIAGVLGYIFWPSNKEDNKEEVRAISASQVNNEFFEQTSLDKTTYTINGSLGDSITTKNGTLIIVPPNAFKDMDGNIISDDVELSFREFHDVPSIFASNIDMTYDSSGLEYHFESAGMFEIGGTKDGDEIAVNDENPIIVELNSQYTGSHYNLYFMDPDGDWEFVKKDTAKLLDMLPESEGSMIADIPTDPMEYSEVKQKWIKYDKARGVYDLKLKNAGLIIPKEADDELFSVKLNFKSDQFPELKGYKNVLFEVTEENKDFDKSLAKQKWTDIELSKSSGDYIMTLFGSQKIDLLVRPVFTAIDMEDAQGNFEELFAAYDAAHQHVLSSAREEMQEAYQSFKATEDSVINVINTTINQMAWNSELDNKKSTVKRVFEVDNFGFWNSDCPQNLPKGQDVIPVFVNADEVKDTLTFENLYIAEYDKNAFYTYWGVWGQKKYVDENGKEKTAFEGPSFTFNPKSETVLWAITNKGELAVIIPEELSKVSFNEDEATTIKMKLHKNIVSANKIKEAIGWN
ncbi:hypothetical protein [Parvicella tangerina]|uniref:Uncharacterized protein n=1 Tax=Parvicella tangerina TaxID=2829795 RepID=A0A916JQU4_9FLAO|nr:hypothetical protein [Parvicella tangerina]CAG5087618.1 hypothetical protein CRYO30217_03528 [Parvicella tangerina]